MRDQHEPASHTPVLADEVVFLLRPRRGGWLVDGTVGMGGHAEQLLEFGEERHAHRIARALVEQRRRAPVRTAADLVSVVKRAVPRAAWSRRTHVATRTFQAVRMAVNDEPDALVEALPQAAALLEDGGRLGVISFHSGEDRVVKRAFRSLADRGFVELEPSPVTAGREETTQNPRARRAKLRVLGRQEAA